MLKLLSCNCLRIFLLSIVALVIFSISTSNLKASSADSSSELDTFPFTDRKKVGDVWLVGSVLYAYGMSLGLSDLQGTVELTEVEAMSLLIATVFKATIKEWRPNKLNRHSFPSGHSVGAFSAATFVHKRYGFTQAILPYLMATAVAWSRVDQRYHYTHDVLAGAAIASLCSYLFVGKNENVTFSYNLKEVEFGISLHI